MNVVKEISRINDKEIALGVGGDVAKSWHYQYKDSAYIYVGGLDYELTEGDILCIFSQYGEIVDINLAKDPKTGKSRGFCFLAYEDQRSTVLAVDNFNGAKVLGRTLRVDHVVQYKKPKKKEGEPEEEDDDDVVNPLEIYRKQRMEELKQKYGTNSELEALQEMGELREKKREREEVGEDNKESKKHKKHHKKDKKHHKKHKKDKKDKKKDKKSKMIREADGTWREMTSEERRQRKEEKKRKKQEKRARREHESSGQSEVKPKKSLEEAIEELKKAAAAASALMREEMDNPEKFWLERERERREQDKKNKQYGKGFFSDKDEGRKEEEKKTGDISMTLEETNKVRASLGLKPLKS